MTRVAIDRPAECLGRIKARLMRVENLIHHQLVAHSILVLRVTVGAVFLCFGALKYFPGVSPAEGLAKETAHLLTFGVIPDGVRIVVIATLDAEQMLCVVLEGHAPTRSVG